jgi:hypothetical protein
MPISLRKIIIIFFLCIVINANSQTHFFRANNGFNYVPQALAISNGLDFSGNADYVDCGTNSKLNLTSSITVELWIKPTRNLGVFGWDRIVHRDWPTGYFFGGRNGSTNALTMVLSGNQNVITTPNNTVDVGVWQHIAFVVDDPGNYVYIYKNGNLVSSAVWTGTISGNPSSQLTLSQNSESFGGVMDDVRIWNVARSQSQIQNNMNNELVGNEAGLVAYYTFNHGTAGGNNSSITSIIDKTLNPSNGTLMSFTKSGTSSNFVLGKVPM